MSDTESKLFPTIGAIAQHALLRGDFDLTVQTAASLMEEKGVSSIVIEQGQERFIFSIEDVLSFTHDYGDFEAPLSHAPHRKIDCMPEGEKILAALEFLENSKQRYLGVAGPTGALLGIVTYSDILNSIDPSVLMERKTVGALISRIAPVMFTADWILEDVVHHIRKLEDSIIVVEAGRPIGIVTAKDVFGIITSGGVMNQPLSDCMICPVITTPYGYTISDALSQLRTHNIKRAIIVDEQQRVVGVVTQSELVGYAYGAWVNLMKHHTAELHELIAMLETKNQNLERLTNTDALTGLGNRRMLQHKMLEEIERIRRYNVTPFSLAIIDVDRFKQLNDQHGHVLGDEALRVITGVLEGLIRKSDTAVRWGGDEFAVLLANTSLADAALFSNRLRELVEQMSFHDEAQLSISVGVGEYALDEDESSFFQRVDRALYRAKDKGRNLVEVAD